ncbi:hypothetical protein UT300018_16970 [Clostridium faecium]
MNMKLLYEKIAIVFQNFKQYAVTLKENITLDLLMKEIILRWKKNLKKLILVILKKVYMME